jgi:flagellar motor switch/type III secretory pathway protein FliN
VLSELTGETVRLLATRPYEARYAAAPGPCACCLLQTPDQASRVLVLLEPALAARLAARLLRRIPPAVDPVAPVPDCIQGAVAALALTAARRLGTEQPLTWGASGAAALQARSTMGPEAIALDFTVLLSDEAFVVTVLIDPAVRSAPPPFDREALRAMGCVPLTLRLVAGQVCADAALVGSLRVGDVLMPGEGLGIRQANGSLVGEGVLCTTGGDTGLRVKLIDSGEVVLVGGLMSADVDTALQAGGERDVAEVLGPAPVVVRVELGQVSMTAQQWAELRPGDIVATGQRLGERAVLRIAGRQVARGELVDLVGELGVRIHELSRQYSGEKP